MKKLLLILTSIVISTSCVKLPIDEEIDRCEYDDKELICYNEEGEEI